MISEAGNSWAKMLSIALARVASRLKVGNTALIFRSSAITGETKAESPVTI
jgi:hypothetical protein